MSVTDAADPVEPSPTAGVDWATDNHAVAVVAPDGEQILRFSVTHDMAGLRRWSNGCWVPGWPRSGSSVRTRREACCARLLYRRIKRLP